jgi:hypothetical protein
LGETNRRVGRGIEGVRLADAIMVSFGGGAGVRINQTVERNNGVKNAIIFIRNKFE